MRVLIFGDSMIYGFGLPEGSWVDYLRRDFDKRITEGEPDDHVPEIYNLGISGDTSQGVLRRLDVEVPARKWHDEELAVCVAIGINDTKIEGTEEFSTSQVYRANLGAILNKLSGYTKRIMFVGLTAVDDKRTNPVSWRDVSWQNQRIKAFEKELRTFVEEHSLPFVPLYEKIEGRADLLYDGLHANPEGHRLIADSVKPELEKLVK